MKSAKSDASKGTLSVTQGSHEVFEFVQSFPYMMFAHMSSGQSPAVLSPTLSQPLTDSTSSLPSQIRGKSVYGS